MRRWRAGAAALALAGVLAVAGCGGGTRTVTTVVAPPAGGTTAAATTPAPATTSAGGTQPIEAWLPQAGEIPGLEPDSDEDGPAPAGPGAAAGKIITGSTDDVVVALGEAGFRRAAIEDLKDPGETIQVLTEAAAVEVADPAAAKRLASQIAEIARQGEGSTSTPIPGVPGGFVVVSPNGDSRYATAVAPQGSVVVWVARKLPDGETDPSSVVDGVTAVLGRMAGATPGPSALLTPDQQALIDRVPQGMGSACGPADPDVDPEGATAVVECVLPSGTGPGVVAYVKYTDAAAMTAGYDEQVEALDVPARGDCENGLAGRQTGSRGGEITCVYEDGEGAILWNDDATATRAIAQRFRGADDELKALYAFYADEAASGPLP